MTRSIDNRNGDNVKTTRNHDENEAEDTNAMAVKVSFVNVGKDLWTYICRHTPPPLAISNLDNERQLTGILVDGRIDSRVIVLGHHMHQPLKIANWIQDHDPTIKIFLLRKPADFEILKQTIVDMPELTQKIELWSTANIKLLPAALKEAVDIINNRKIDSNVELENLPLTEHIELTSFSEVNTENKLDTILDAASIGLICIDDEDTILEINTPAAFMLNLDEQDSLGTPLSLIFEQADLIKLHHIINTCDDLEEDIPHQIKYIEANGSLKYFRVSAFTEDTNEDYKINLILQDVTENSIAESKLEQEKQRNRITLKLLNDGVITTDMNCKIESMNPVAEGLTGWPSYEAKEHHLDNVFKLIDANTRERKINLGLDCLKSSKPIETRNNLIFIRQI